MSPTAAPSRPASSAPRTMPGTAPGPVAGMLSSLGTMFCAIVAAKEDENGSGDAEVSSAAPLTETSSEEELVPPAEAVTAEQGPANGDGAEDDGGPADANEAETVALISDDAGADGQEESAESPIASTSDDAGAGEQDDFTEPSTEETAA